MKWTKEEMESYVKLRRSLSSKGKRSKSSPPWSSSHYSDIDISIATQLDSIDKSEDRCNVSNFISQILVYVGQVSA